MSDFLGYGLLQPFQRDRKGDFANAGGVRLVASVVAQVLGTRAASGESQGELPWRTNAGSQLYILRHRNNNATTRELAFVYAQEAVRRWEPRALITDVEVIEPDRLSELNRLIVRVKWRPISVNVTGNRVLLEEQTTEIPL